MRYILITILGLAITTTLILLGYRGIYTAEGYIGIIFVAILSIMLGWLIGNGGNEYKCIRCFNKITYDQAYRTSMEGTFNHFPICKICELKFKEEDVSQER